MELGLSLGDAPKPFRFVEKQPPVTPRPRRISRPDLGFCVDLSIGRPVAGEKEDDEEKINQRDYESDGNEDPPIQLDLLPHNPVPRNLTNPYQGFPWPSSENDEGEDRTASPNSAASSFQMEFGLYGGGGNISCQRDQMENGVIESERASSRASDEDENGSTRKKLRLSKEQSAFLEESFKEHNTLNPKQKLALAKQLNLRPRQVEVWFQNRRARTKLKQTEVDCEYLKRCCETLTEENRRLQKEVQELRALKTTDSFYMQLPATTLTMCPSCERVTSTSAGSSGGKSTEAVSKRSGFAITGRPSSSSFPFSA
ncbi:homeobox-leucine zipper protein HOX11-like [Cucurbita maxima]|uniref:Homeobox-leucine zipper protein HOX11-like n=1 Tax=Cucurbita maxima TaxID=3661 RepID=A0A6J1JXM6_CUCMA|nr:homeobox-leucine zipper protein HOX11-like [Cucurbita maxima]